MYENTEKITQNRIFANISAEVMERIIIPRGTLRVLSPGENIFMTLDRVNTIHILLSGKVKLAYYLENGDQDIKNMLLPGSIVGIDLVCTRTQLSPYQATAVEKCEIFSVPADIILDSGIIPESDRINCLSNTLMIISRANMQNEYRLAILTRSSLRERIMVYLTMQANRNQSKTFSIPFTRDEMASFLRVNRSALSHELSLLRQEGIIDFKKNAFSLTERCTSGFDDAVY